MQNTQEKKFLTAADVAEYMSISKSMAYTIIRKMNKELESRGKIIVHGKISRRYFEEKIYV
ncbi:MAG: DNA-binding protein [Clostridia bacterium]|nr:DNA-binding protein [Clostridia bacterium]